MLFVFGLFIVMFVPVVDCFLCVNSVDIVAFIVN